MKMRLSLKLGKYEVNQKCIKAKGEAKWKKEDN